jgi:hypothetical protein
MQFELAPHIEEVVRCLPAEQYGHIRRHADQFYSGSTNLENSIFATRIRPGYDIPSPLYDSVLPQIINGLAWKDLEIAERTGFRPRTPDSAMRISVLALKQAVGLSRGTHKTREDFLRVATGMVGLHASILGPVDLLEDETAVQNLQHTHDLFKSKFVMPLALKKAAERRNEIRRR